MYRVNSTLFNRVRKPFGTETRERYTHKVTSHLSTENHAAEVLKPHYIHHYFQVLKYSTFLRFSCTYPYNKPHKKYKSHTFLNLAPHYLFTYFVHYGMHSLFILAKTI